MTPYEILLSEIAGAHARRRGARPRGGGPGDPAPSGTSPPTSIGEVTDDGSIACHEGRRGRRDPGPAPGRRLPDVRARRARERGRARRAARPRPAAHRRPISEDALPAAARRAQRSPASAGSTSSTTPPCRRPPCSAPAATPACSRCRAPASDLALKSTATAATSRSTPTRAARPRWPRPRATSPAPARARWASPTASTSATRRSRRSSSSSARPCRGMAEACRAFDTPVTGGNVSLLQREPDRRGLSHADDRHGGPAGAHRRPGAQPLSPRRATRSSSSGATRGELGGSAYWAEVRDFVGGQPARVDLEAERRLQQLLVGRGPAAAAPLGARLLRGRARRGAGRGGDRRCRTRARGLGRDAGPDRLRGRRGAGGRCSSARTAPAWSSPCRPATPRRCSTLAARARRAGASRPARVGERGRRAGTPGRAIELFSWGIDDASGRSITTAIPRRMAARRIVDRSRRGELRHVRHLRGLRAARRGAAHVPRALRPAAPRPGERGHRRDRPRGQCARRIAAWGSCRENFDGRRSSPSCRATSRSATRATPRRAAPCSPTRSRARRHALRPARPRAQRQPDQRRRAQAGAGREGRDLHHLERTPRCSST